LETSTWTNREGLALLARHWPAAGTPRGVLALVHGQGEHAGRYDHLARWYNARGLAVLGYDQQGYGESAGIRGHVRSYDALLDDVGLLLDEAHARYRGVPLFLYGHSMGGNIVLNYVLRRHPALHGAVATGPWIRLAFQPPWLKVTAGRLLARLRPSLTLPTNLAAEFLSHDKAVVDAYRRDPLVHDQVSTGAGIALLESATWLDRYEGGTALPLLLQHGGADRITSAPATAALAKRISGDVTYREWPGLYHEIHNEVEQEEVFAFTLAWLERHLP
jgi:alpha-beta hydrolase superfamily lysophospholipase